MILKILKYQFFMCGMTEKKAVGSSYIIYFIYFLVRYWMSHWSKGVRDNRTDRQP